MRLLFPSLCLVLVLCGCQAPQAPVPITVIVGAVLFDGTGGPPISDSVVTIEGARIRAVGTRETLPIPTLSEKINGAGKFLVPALIDVDAADGPEWAHLGVATVGRPVSAATPADVERLAAAHTSAVLIRPGDPETVFDAARRYQIPAIADIFSLRDCQTMVTRGAAGFLHMIRDTEAIDPAFLARLRDLRLAFAPELAQLSGAQLEIAKHNTLRLAAAGVPIAAGGDAAAYLRELGLLAEAGLTSSEVLAAATHNGGMALGRADQVGSIEPGKSADLLLLSANPAEDVRNLQKIDRMMKNGLWVER